MNQRGEDKVTNDGKEDIREEEGSSSMGMGPDHKTTLSPLPEYNRIAIRPSLVKRKVSASATPPPTSNRAGVAAAAAAGGEWSTSQHTEIEYYTDDEAGQDGDGGGDGDENSFTDDNQNYILTTPVPPPPSSGRSGRRGEFQRATSHYSIQSTASDAFSLPVGAQDDVSSLEYDQNNIDDDDEYGVDDISLKELLGEDNVDDYQRKDRQSTPVVEVDTSEMVKSPIVERATVDLSRLHALREAFNNSKTQMGLDHLPEVANEDEQEDEDDDDDDDKPMGFDSLLRKTSSQEYAEGVGDGDYDGMAAVTKRMHKSLFLPHGASLLADSPSATPRTQNRKRLGGRSPTGNGSLRSASLFTDDFDILAKNLPPELDLKEARKYIIQLAEGVPDTPISPAQLGKPKYFVDENNIPRQSLAKSSIMESSEYSDDDDDDEEEEEVEEAVEDESVPLDPRLPRTPKSDRIPTMRNRPRESFLSYDYTEIVDSDEEFEEVIEEEIIDDDEEEEVAAYEENGEAAAPAAALDVASAMVGAATTT